MDPLSVLGVVAATVQFVDFSSKLLSGSLKIFTSSSGELLDQKRRTSIAEDLRGLNEKIQTSAKASVQSTVTDQDECDLLELCAGCDDVAQQLLGALNKFKPNKAKSKTLETCRVALESIWSGDVVDQLEQRLSSYRQQMTLHMIWIMKKQLQFGLDNLAEGQKRARDDIVQLVNKDRDWKEGVIAAIPAVSLPETRPNASKDTQSSFAVLVCRQLYFERISYREERIPDAHKTTFEWIFQPPAANQRTWADFGEWLKSDSSIYWITGKAGAGKSTLMKFIGHDQRTIRMLAESAEGRRLAIGRFYFWNSGVDLQMTQEGLLRTLTYNILQQCPDLAIKAFPRQWELFQLFGIFDPERIDYLGLKRLLDRIIKADPSTQFVFFIDGLDEFIGDKSDLAAYAKQLSDNSNTKVCVSSRPWNEFEDAFANTPSLKIESFTYRDIVSFIESNFNESPGYAELRAENEAEAKDLMHAIASKSSGVFLWVNFVVKSLLSGLTNGERLSTLEGRLDALPPDLEHLFQKMLDQIDDEHREGASRLFQIVKAAFKPPNVITLAWADEDDPNLPLVRGSKPLSVNERDAKSLHLIRRLNSHCRGLLEADKLFLSEGNVEFIHRTVKDFLYQDEVWLTLQSWTPTSFHPEEALCRSYLLRLKSSTDKVGLNHGPITTALRNSTVSGVSDMLVQFVRYTHKMYEKTGDAQLQLYDELAKTAKDIFNPRGRCFSRDGVCWCEGPVDHDDGLFLSLAVALHIIPYVDARLTSLPAQKAEDPSGHSLFQIADLSGELSELSTWSDAFCFDKDNHRLKELLLAHFAGQKLSTDPERPELQKEMRKIRRRNNCSCLVRWLKFWS